MYQDKHLENKSKPILLMATTLTLLIILVLLIFQNIWLFSTWSKIQEQFKYRTFLQSGCENVNEVQ